MAINIENVVHWSQKLIGSTAADTKMQFRINNNTQFGMHNREYRGKTTMHHSRLVKSDSMKSVILCRFNSPILQKDAR